MAEHRHPDVARAITRRQMIMRAAAGSVITALGGGLYILRDDLIARARAETREDGRPRVPPGQRVVGRLQPMGGAAGDPSPRNFRLAIHGAVERPFEVSFRDLLEMDVVEQAADVHCVTGWSLLGGRWKGVRVKDLARRAGVKKQARHVIFEAAHGYTANARLDEGIAENVLVTWQLDGRPLGRPHGSPARGLVPDLYFWKSVKWITGIRFSERDEPGYWETRGYNNHGDPWREERYA
jgi:DMSO/TMAO reductase YedYZ molybdopterin-dependent catalytic subunit